MTNFLKKYSRYFERPLKVQLDVTNKCNLDCLYCYNKSNDFLIKNELSDDKLFIISKKIVDELNPVVLSLSGGEPLLKKELLYKIIKYATKANIEVWLTSNLLLLDKKTADKLKKSGLKKIFTNIDSVNFKIHDQLRGKIGAFDTLLSNIIYVKDVFGTENITITSVITKYNYKDTESLVDLMHDLGLTRLKLLDFIPINKTSIGDVLSKKQWEEFYNIYKTSKRKGKLFNIVITPCHALLFMGPEYKKMKFPFCVAGRFNLVVLTTGEVVPCNHLKFKEFLCGDAINDSLLDIWQNSPILERFRYDLKNYETCSGCPRYTKCAGGCKAMSYAFNNMAFNKDPYCVNYKLNENSYE